jgi:hypothetical protein
MTDAAELRKNAMICEDLANRCKSEVEREQWLRMQQSWLALAENREKSSLAPGGDGTAPDPSPRGPQSETDR